MNRRLSIAIFAAVLLLCASFAHAQVQQYQLMFTNQTAVIPATPITPLLSADTPMIVFADVTSFQQVYVSYTDPNGSVRALPLGLGQWQWGIIVGAGTAPAIESFDPSSAPFDAYIEALALIGPDQQGGMDETIRREQYNLSGTVTEILDVPAVSETILISSSMSAGGSSVVIGWTDSDGPHTQTVATSVPLNSAAPGNGSPILLHSIAGAAITLKATGGTNYTVQTRGIRFSTPAPGAGPFSGVVADLDQTSAIGLTTVLVVPSSAEYLLVPLQVAASYSCVGSTGSGTFSARYYAEGSLLSTVVGGQLGQFAQSEWLEATTGVRFLTATYSDMPVCTPPASAVYSVTYAALAF
jgi:hypothetical protein